MAQWVKTLDTKTSGPIQNLETIWWEVRIQSHPLVSKHTHIHKNKGEFFKKVITLK